MSIFGVWCSIRKPLIRENTFFFLFIFNSKSHWLLCIGLRAGLLFSVSRSYITIRTKIHLDCELKAKELDTCSHRVRLHFESCDYNTHNSLIKRISVSRFYCLFVSLHWLQWIDFVLNFWLCVCITLNCSSIFIF